MQSCHENNEQAFLRVRHGRVSPAPFSQEATSASRSPKRFSVESLCHPSLGDEDDSNDADHAGGCFSSRGSSTKTIRETTRREQQEEWSAQGGHRDPRAGIDAGRG